MVSTKGGTGKSTLSIGVGIEISKLFSGRDERVVIVDGDQRIKTTELKMIDIGRDDPRLDDVLDGRARWKDAVYSCCLMRGRKYLYPNLAIMPAGAFFLPLSELDPKLERIREKVDRFGGLVDEIKERCAFAIIDTPASFSLEHLAMIGAADAILPVVNPNDDSITSTLNMLREARNLMDYVDVLGCVVNRVPEHVDADPWVEKASEIGEVLGIIPSDRYVDLAFSANYPVAALYPNAPSVRAMRSLAARVTSVAIPETKLKLVSKLDRTIDVMARRKFRERHPEIPASKLRQRN